jgi:[FeFe] hydrogenase H-cluster maturation GTPase HydF
MPAASRKYIVLFGETNAGKSALFNALLNQPRAIVSDIPGTTADPVLKAIELIPYGPVTLVDTAGLNDATVLGAAREQKTKRWLDTADLALYVIDPAKYNEEKYTQMAAAFRERRLPFLVVFTKQDLSRPPHEINRLKIKGVKPFDLKSFGDEPSLSPAVFYVSVFGPSSIEALRQGIITALQTETKAEPSLIAGVVPSGGTVVLVAPIDSEAPAGRLILPQVQLLRACLDERIRVMLIRPEDISRTLADLPHIDLVVTDSQVFPPVSAAVPAEIPLTSFSILTARQKGDFSPLYNGAQKIYTLRPGDKILLAEACTHNTSHEDIGRVKLPKALEKTAGGKLDFTFSSGKEFPDELGGYALIVHCGGCMLTRRAFLARQERAEKANVPFTNYGLALAACAKILERSAAFFTA